MVDQMQPIDENIENYNLVDASVLQEVIQEKDAVPGGKWEDSIRSQHQRVTQGVTASFWVSISKRLRRELVKSGHASSPHSDYGIPTTIDLPPVFDDSDYSDDEENNDVSDGEEDNIQTSPIQAQDDSNNRGSEDVDLVSDDGEDVEDNHGSMHALQNPVQDVAGGNDNVMRHGSEETEDEYIQPASATMHNDSQSSSEDSEDEEFNAAEIEEEEAERISKLFEDFPTTISTADRVDSSNEEYGTTAISQNPRWEYITPARLLPRVRMWLAQFASE